MAAESRRTGRWIPIVYYYLATVIGLIILLVGLIQGLRGLARAAFPQLAPEVRFLEPIGPPEFAEAKPPPEPGAVRPIRERPKGSARELAKLREERHRDALHNARLGGFGDALQGLVVVIVGAPVFFWHLRQARRKEPEWMGLGPAPQAPAPAPQAPPAEEPRP